MPRMSDEKWSELNAVVADTIGRPGGSYCDRDVVDLQREVTRLKEEREADRARLAELIAAAEEARVRLKYIAITSVPMSIEWREHAGETAEKLRAAVAPFREVQR